MRTTQHRMRQRRGVTLVGYGLIVGLISIVALSAITAVGSQTDELFDDVGDTLNTVVTGQAGPAATATPTPAPAASCAEHLSNGVTTSGTYLISLPEAGTVSLFCDMTNNGGGWTLVMRGFGGDNGSWVSASGSVGTIDGASPGMAESYKLTDNDINSVRNGGIYRISYNGTASGYTATPPTVFIPSTCTYNHTTSPGTACRQWSESVDFSGLTTSTTNGSRRGIDVSISGSASGNLWYLTNFNDSVVSEDGWYMGDLAVGGTAGFCFPATSGCNFVMYVR